MRLCCRSDSRRHLTGFPRPRRGGRFSARRFTLRVILLLAVGLGAAPAWALGPDQLLLIVNRHVSEGAEAAMYYAQQRHVPAGRVVVLDVPVSEEISFASYQKDVVPVVRDFLKKNNLEQKVTCLVTFYGVPIRIGARPAAPGEKEEAGVVEGELKALAGRVAGLVEPLEKLAVEADASYKPAAGGELEALNARAEGAWRDLAAKASAMPAGPARDGLSDKINALMVPLLGPASVLRQRAAEVQANPNATPEQKKAIVQAMNQFRQLAEQINAWQQHADQPENRAKLRAAVRDNLGPFEYARMLRSQATYLTNDGTPSAFDSELALLWWDNYPRSGWQANLLNYRVRPLPAAPPVMMTMRLDGPDAGSARAIVAGSLKAEAEGLKGKIVIDSRGKPAVDAAGKPEPYGMYDQTLRNLAEIVRGKTKLDLVFDDKDPVLPAHSVKGVGLYVGWYSLRHYVPCCEFYPGAVGFHIASMEMASLRAPGEPGWCHGLLQDGAAATLGPVSEPFLHSFPPADDFFPLLMTGKLTLAEVYWKTTPLTSWQQNMIGDPLYTPYKQNPAIKVEDLPARLRTVFETPTTQAAPATGRSK